MYSFVDFESTDFRGEKYKDTYEFFLNKAELMNLEHSVDGGYSGMLKRIMATKDKKLLLQEFQKLVLLSYGKVSPDGKYFIKNAELTEQFKSSSAYPDIYMLLAVNAKIAADFCNKIVPENLEEQIKAAMEFE